MLIRRKEDYDYIRGYVEGNQIILSILDSQEWIQIKRDDKAYGYDMFHSSGSGYLFTASGWYFKYSMIAIAGMVGLIIVFGTFYESYRCNTDTK